MKMRKLLHNLCLIYLKWIFQQNKTSGLFSVFFSISLSKLLKQTSKRYIIQHIHTCLTNVFLKLEKISESKHYLRYFALLLVLLKQTLIVIRRHNAKSDCWGSSVKKIRKYAGIKFVIVPLIIKLITLFVVRSKNVKTSFLSLAVEAYTTVCFCRAGWFIMVTWNLWKTSIPQHQYIYAPNAWTARVIGFISHMLRQPRLTQC